MNLLAQIVGLSWLVFLAFWLLKAIKVKATKEVRRRFTGFWNVAGGLFFSLLMLSGIGNLHIFPLSFIIWPHFLWLAWGSTGLTVLGLVIAIVARHTIDTNWSGNIEIKQDHELITDGVYGWVRHPIYSGILLMALGTCLFSGSVGGVLFFLLLLFMILYKIGEEEKLLEKYFPKDYREYKARVKMLIPRVM